jgi:hypothetical protein
MVNFGLNPAAILGLFLAIAGAGLYFLRSIRPELSRDYDIFFAAVGLLCGLILFFNGWRLDPILQFGQFLLTGTAIFFVTEAVRLRGTTVEQAKRSSPFAERGRPTSKKPVYTDAQLDLQLEPYEEDDYYEDKRRLRGSEDARDRRSSSYEVDEPRPSRSRRTSERYDDYTDTPRKRRPRSSAESSGPQYDMWEDSQDRAPKPSANRPRRSRFDRDSSEDSAEAPKKRRRPSSSGSSYTRREADSVTTDYVDYQPIDESEIDDFDRDREIQPKTDRSPERKPRNPSSPTSENRDNPLQFDY